MSSGQLVTFIYVTMYILVPMVSNLIFGQTSWSIYYYNQPATFVLLLILGFWLLIASPLFRFKILRRRFLNETFRKSQNFLRRHTLTLAIFIGFLIGLFYSTSNMGFRYEAEGISSGGWKLILVTILQAVASILLMWLVVIFKVKGEKIRIKDRFSVWVLTAALLYTISGAASFLNAALFLIFSLFPKFFLNIVFIKVNSPVFSVKFIWSLIFPPLLLIVVVFFALTVGDAIKMRSAPDIGELTFSIKFLVIRIVDGISTHYYALVQFFEPRTYYFLERYDYPLNYHWTTIQYRLGQILGLETTRPEVQSLMRLNFLVNSFHIDEIQGTSPGAIASFVYILPLPLGLIVALLYLRWVNSLLDRFFFVQGFKLSVFGGIFAFQQMLFLYQSPVDFLVIFDNATILLFVTWFIAKMRSDNVFRKYFKAQITKYT